jgi:hypothetical protein
MEQSAQKAVAEHIIPYYTEKKKVYGNAFFTKRKKFGYTKNNLKTDCL